MLMFSIICMAFTAYLPVRSHTLLGFLLKIDVFILAVIFYFALAALVYFFKRKFPLNLISLTAFALESGLMLMGPVFAFANMINVTIVPEALAIASGALFVLCLLQRILRKDLTSWEPWLIFALLAAIVFTVAEIFIKLTLFRVAVDLGVVVLFMPLILFDIGHILNKMNDEDWIEAVINLYLDFANILIRVIAILIEIYSEK